MRNIILICALVLLGIALVVFLSTNDKQIEIPIEQPGLETEASSGPREVSDEEYSQIYLSEGSNVVTIDRDALCYESETAREKCITDLRAEVQTREVKSYTDSELAFLKFPSGYTIQEGRIFYSGVILPDADLDEFTILVPPSPYTHIKVYAKDTEDVYFKGEKIDEADAETFRLVTSWRAVDSNYFYVTDQSIPNLDAASIEDLGGSYFKDINGIWYDPPKDDDTYTFIQVDGADANTFEYVSGYFAKDSTNVYHQGSVVAGADAETFKKAPGQGAYYIDSVAVYRNRDGIPMEDVDAATFTHVVCGWWRDKNNVYEKLGGGVKEGVDPDTFDYPCPIDEDYSNVERGVFY